MKQTVNSIRVNYIMNVFLNGSAYILPLLAKPYVSRILLADGMGKVSIATSQIAYFTMFVMLGVPTYGIRACARVRDDREELSRTAEEIFLLNLVLAIPVYACLFWAVCFIPKMHEMKDLLLVMSGTIIFNVIGMEWLYRGLEEYVKLATRSLLFKLVAIALIFLFVRKKQDYVVYGGCTMLASYGANLVNFAMSHKYFDKVPIRISGIKRHIKPTLIFFAMSVATTVYTNLDVVMLGFMSDDIQAGYYDATLTIKLILIGAVTSLGAVMLPRVSYYIEKGMYEEFFNVSKRALNCIILLAIPLTTYFCFYARNTILVFSGEGFSGAVLPMKILIPTVLMIGLTNITGIQMLVPLGKEKIVLYSEIGGAMVDLLVNFMLIPKLGAAGAAIGTLVAEFTVMIIQFYAIRAKLWKMLKKISIYKIVMADMIAIFFSVILTCTGLSPFLNLCVTFAGFMIIYIGSLLILKEKETVRLIKTIKRA